MPRQKKKSQYTEINNRNIYAIINPITKEFYISHCRSDLIIDVFKDHYHGQRYQTQKSFLELKHQNQHPCLFILEEINTTKVEAYKHVIAWTKIFIENEYTPLNTGNILHYIEDLHDDSLNIYNKNRRVNLSVNCSCKKCIVSQYNCNTCRLYMEVKND